MTKQRIINTWIEQGKRILRYRWFRWFVQLLIIGMCSIYLIDNLKGIRASQLDITINVPLIILSVITTILAVFLGAYGFYLVLRAMYISINWFEAMNVHLQSNLAKYIPGYAWQLIGKAYFNNQYRSFDRDGRLGNDG